MFTCKFCLLQFNTEPELNIHNEKCRENVQSLPKIAGELDAHACRDNDRLMLSCLTKLLKLFMEFMKKRPKVKTLGQCLYCSQELYTVDEVIEHRETCIVLQMENAIEIIDKNFKKMTSVLVEPIKLIPMSLSPKPLTSEENKSSKKRVLDTSTERNNVTKSESSMETSSPPSKICRSSDKDIKDIETKQESAIDSKICDAKTKTCAKKTFDCVFCERKFQSLDVLQTHIIPCCKTVKK